MTTLSDASGVRYTFDCDGPNCGAVLHTKTTRGFHSAIQELKTHGWANKAVESGWKQYCPACQDEMDKAANAKWTPTDRLKLIAQIVRPMQDKLKQNELVFDDTYIEYGELFDTLSRIMLIITESPRYLEKHKTALLEGDTTDG